MNVKTRTPCVWRCDFPGCKERVVGYLEVRPDGWTTVDQPRHELEWVKHFCGVHSPKQEA